MLRRYVHTSVVLRPYQEDCICQCITWLHKGATRLGVSLPTGSGKTTVFISLLSRLDPPAKNEATRALVIVNSVELAKQSAAQASRMFPEWSVEIEQGANHRASGLADFTVATYQTLLNPERLAKFDPQKTRAIIIDEAHHAAAPSYRKFLSHFHEDIRHPDPDYLPAVRPGRVPVIGFSATFSRHDGLALSSVFERIVYHRDILEMMKEYWLCDVRLTSVRVSLGLDAVPVSANGDFSTSSLASIMNTPTMNELVVRTWLDRAVNRKSTLIFCVDIAHVQDLAAVFRQFGIDARFLTGRTHVTTRQELVDSFKAGEFPVLINCAVLTEGTDIPNIDCVIVARPTRSRNVFTQMIGRGMRLSPNTDKEDCHIIDYVDIINRVAGVMSVPTLFGLDPMKLKLENKSLVELERQAKQPDIPLEVTNNNASPSFAYLEHGSLDALCGALKDKEVRIRRLSPFAWVTCTKDVYVLQTFFSGKLKIILDHDAALPFTVRRYYRAFFPGKGRIETSHCLLTAATLEDAIHGADTWAQQHAKGNSSALRHSAPWRRYPATSAQITQIMDLYSKSKSTLKAFLAAVGLKLREGQSPTAEEMKARFKLMKKGQLFDAIVRLKHKSDKHYTKVEEEAEKWILKQQKIQEKELKRKAHETVSIGPLHTPNSLDTQTITTDSTLKAVATQLHGFEG